MKIKSFFCWVHSLLTRNKVQGIIQNNPSLDSPTMKISDWFIKVRRCHDSVIFILSSLFGHVNNPLAWLGWIYNAIFNLWQMSCTLMITINNYFNLKNTVFVINLRINIFKTKQFLNCLQCKILVLKSKKCEWIVHWFGENWIKKSHHQNNFAINQIRRRRKNILDSVYPQTGKAANYIGKVHKSLKWD